jgi:hypothetical protein
MENKQPTVIPLLPIFGMDKTITGWFFQQQ